MLIVKKLLALAAIPAAFLAGTTAASASTGRTLYARCATNDGGACAGYVLSGARFQHVTAAAFLRNPDQYSAITNGIGWQVGLKAVPATGNTWDAIMGVSDVPNSGAGYSPQSLVYENRAIVAVAPNAVWCPAGQPCQPASAGGAFPVGTTVTQSVTYNRTEGTVNFSARDTAGDLYKAFYVTGTGISFGQARIEAGYGTFTPPAANTKLVAVNSAGVTTYNGKKHPLTGFFTTSPEKGTSTGTGAGTLQAYPTALNSTGTGFSVLFAKAPPK